jgi:hypothetical protein
MSQLGHTRPPQEDREALHGRSGDPQFSDAIAAAATNGQSVPIFDSCSAAIAELLNYLVGAGKEQRGNSEPE